MRRALLFKAVHACGLGAQSTVNRATCRFPFPQQFRAGTFDVFIDLPPVASSSKAWGWLNLYLRDTWEPQCSNILNLVLVFELSWFVHIKILVPNKLLSWRSFIPRNPTSLKPGWIERPQGDSVTLTKCFGMGVVGSGRVRLAMTEVNRNIRDDGIIPIRLVLELWSRMLSVGQGSYSLRKHWVRWPWWHGMAPSILSLWDLKEIRCSFIFYSTNTYWVMNKCQAPQVLEK